jgi:hypothetical protein
VEFLSRKRFVNRRGIQLDESMEDSVSPVNSQPNLSVARFVSMPGASTSSFQLRRYRKVRCRHLRNCRQEADHYETRW